MLVNEPLAAPGRPLLNTAAEALAMLCERPELDYVLIEEWLFDKEKLECA